MSETQEKKLIDLKADFKEHPDDFRALNNSLALIDVDIH